jgi:hypothetical protein
MTEKTEKEFYGVDKFDHVHTKPRRRIFVDNLLGGLAWGVGSILGATIIIGVLGLVITRSRNIPLIGDVVQIILDEIQQGRDTNIFINGEPNTENQQNQEY